MRPSTIRKPAVLENLRKILRSDAFDPTAEVFPDLNMRELSRQLKPEAAGQDRGRRNQPQPEVVGLDSEEMELVDAVDKLRTLGIKLYREHTSVYSDRLGNAVEVRNEVRLEAGKSAGNFKSECKRSEAAMQPAVTGLEEARAWKNSFMQRHRLIRPGIRLQSGGVKWVAVAALLILIEALLNSYLFSQKNEFGLLGGVAVALLISIANVGAASVAGYFSRFIWHVNWLVKLFGLIIIVVWLAFVLIFNFGLAHFRDALVSIEGLDWNSAAGIAVEKTRFSILAVESLESWLLVVIGFLISLSAFLKGFYADDPYPQYGQVERVLDRHRRNHLGELETTLTLLQQERDDAIALLQHANEQVKDSFSEAIDALHGQSSLDHQLKGFLDRCDSAAQQLLQKYRDANRDARTDPSPPHFDTEYRFPEVPTVQLPGDRLRQAQTTREEIAEIVASAIREICAEYDEAIDRFRTTKDIENAVAPRRPGSRETDG